jgi:hypothetical protein
MLCVLRPVYPLAALALLLLAALAWPGCFDTLGVNVTRIPDDANRLQRENQRGDQLEAAWAESSRRAEKRRHVILQLAAGKLSVPEAARQFWDARVAADEVLRDQLVWERGDTEEERLCRHVIGWIRAELDDRPEEAERAIAKREAELAKHLAKHGRVILPGQHLPPNRSRANR